MDFFNLLQLGAQDTGTRSRSMTRKGLERPLVYDDKIQIKNTLTHFHRSQVPLLYTRSS